MKGHLYKLALSMLFGLLGTFLFYQKLESAKGDAVSKAEMVSVLRVKKFIEAGASITEAHLRLDTIPKGYLEPKAVQSMKELFDSSGQPIFQAAAGLLKGEQLTRTQLIDNRIQLGLSWKLPPHFNAMTLRLNSEQAIGGWANPGDWVQVMWMMDQGPGWREPTAKILVPKAKILAIDNQVISQIGEAAAEKKEKNVSNDLILVTLALTAEDCLRVELARNKGKISFNLMGPSSLETQSLSTVRLRELQ